MPTPEAGCRRRRRRPAPAGGRRARRHSVAAVAAMRPLPRLLTPLLGFSRAMDRVSAVAGSIADWLVLLACLVSAGTGSSAMAARPRGGPQG